MSAFQPDQNIEGGRQSLRDLVFTVLSQAGLLDLSKTNERTPYALPVQMVWPLPRSTPWKIWLHGIPQDVLNNLGIDPVSQRELQSLSPSGLDQILFSLSEALHDRFLIGNRFGASFQKANLPKGLTSAVVQRFLEYIYDHLASLDADQVRLLLSSSDNISFKIPSHAVLQKELCIRGKDLLREVMSSGGILIPDQISGQLTKHDGKSYTSCHHSQTVAGAEFLAAVDKGLAHQQVFQIPRHTLALAWGMRYVLAHRCGLRPTSDETSSLVHNIATWLRHLGDSERRLARHMFLSAGSNGCFDYLADPYWAYQITGTTTCSRAASSQGSLERRHFKETMREWLQSLEDATQSIPHPALRIHLTNAIADIHRSLQSIKPTSHSNSRATALLVKDFCPESAGPLPRKCEVSAPKVRGVCPESARSLPHKCEVFAPKVRGVCPESARSFDTKSNDINPDETQAVPEVLPKGTTLSWQATKPSDSDSQISNAPIASLPELSGGLETTKADSTAEAILIARIGQMAWKGLQTLPVTLGGSPISPKQVIQALDLSPKPMTPEDILHMAIGLGKRAGGTKAAPVRIAMACLRGTSSPVPWIEAGSESIRTTPDEPVGTSSLKDLIIPKNATVWEPDEPLSEHERIWLHIRNLALEKDVHSSLRECLASMVPYSLQDGCLLVKYQPIHAGSVFDDTCDELYETISTFESQLGKARIRFKFTPAC